MVQLSAGGLLLPLVSTPSGVMLDSRAGPLDPLVWLINEAANGQLPGLERALDSGATISSKVVSMWRVPNDRRLEPARKRWRALTGQELGDDVVELALDFTTENLIVPRATVRAILDALLELRAHPEKVPLDPPPDDRALFAGLEAEARELETSDQNAAATAVRRASFLFALDAAGLLDAGASARFAELKTAGFDHLAYYARAASELFIYFNSAERGAHIPGPAPSRIVGSAVSIDWFRSGSPLPIGIHPFSWLGFSERALLDAPAAGGHSGEVYTRTEGGWCVVRWRRDDGVTRAVLSARLLA